MVKVTKPISFVPLYVTERRIGNRYLDTPNESSGNTPSAFRHLRTSHVFGKPLLGAYQMAEGVFPIKGINHRVTS
jgi:hypothetical protein